MQEVVFLAKSCNANYSQARTEDSRDSEEASGRFLKMDMLPNKKKVSSPITTQTLSEITGENPAAVTAAHGGDGYYRSAANISKTS
jgi:hypothetical protein